MPVLSLLFLLRVATKRKAANVESCMSIMNLYSLSFWCSYRQKTEASYLWEFMCEFLGVSCMWGVGFFLFQVPLMWGTKSNLISSSSLLLNVRHKASHCRHTSGDILDLERAGGLKTSSLPRAPPFSGWYFRLSTCPFFFLFSSLFSYSLFPLLKTILRKINKVYFIS